MRRNIRLRRAPRDPALKLRLNGVRDLIADFIGMPLRNAFAGKKLFHVKNPLFNIVVCGTNINSVPREKCACDGFFRKKRPEKRRNGKRWLRKEFYYSTAAQKSQRKVRACANVHKNI